jgi:chromosome segregation ATPase
MYIMSSSSQSPSLQRRIAIQRARLADAKKRVRARIYEASSSIKRKKVRGEEKEEQVNNDSSGNRYMVATKEGFLRRKSPRRADVNSYNNDIGYNNSSEKKVSPSSPRRGTYYGTYSQKSAEFLRKKQRTRSTLNSKYDDSDSDDDEFSSERRTNTASSHNANSNKRSPTQRVIDNLALLTSDEEDDADSLPYDDDAEKNLDVINNSLTNAISNVSSKDITQLVRVSDNVHEVQRLQSNLRTRQMQLESAKEEVVYTGNLVEMLRQTIDKCEKEKTKYERRIVELEEMHLKSEAKISALEQQLEAKRDTYRLLQDDHESLAQDYDKQLGETRITRISGERTRLALELETKNQKAKIETLENALDENRELHQKAQVRLKDAVNDLRNAATARIELNTKLGTLENDMEILSKENDQLQQSLNETTKLLDDTKENMSELGKKLKTCQDDLEDREADCMMRVAKSEAARELTFEQFEQVKNELNVAYGMQEALAKQVNDMEMQLNAQPDVQMVEKEKFDTLQDRFHALKAELGSVTQLLIAKDSTISKLRVDLNDAEASVRSKRQNFARRDSIAARQAATLSAQLQASNSRIDAMNETQAAKNIEIAGLRKRLESSDLSLEQGRDEKAAYVKKYEEAVSQKTVLTEQLSQTREELEAKLYIIQQLNQRLATLESEVTVSENEQRVRSNLISVFIFLHYKYPAVSG